MNDRETDPVSPAEWQARREALAEKLEKQKVKAGLIKPTPATGLRGAADEPIASASSRGSPVLGLPPEHPTAASLLRDAGYDFARAGTLVERADNTARILDMKYYLLLPSLSYVGTTVDSGQWDQILRSVAGDRAYRWLNAGQTDPRGIVQFLVLDERFPRSLAYSHSQLRENLASLARIHGGEGQSNVLIERSAGELARLRIGEVFETGLHEFLGEFERCNAAIARTIAEDYRFLA